MLNGKANQCREKHDALFVVGFYIWRRDGVCKRKWLGGFCGKSTQAILSPEPCLGTKRSEFTA